MLRLLGPDGQLIVLADVLELQSDDPQLALLRTQFEQNAVDNLHIRSLIEKQGLELAVMGISDLADRLKTSAAHYFLWPFDETKSYLVCALT